MSLFSMPANVADRIDALEEISYAKGTLTRRNPLHEMGYSLKQQNDGSLSICHLKAQNQSLLSK